MKENWYDRHLLPYLLDLACGVKPIRRQRQKVVPLAQGRVLEVGIGTGLNLPFYDRSRITTIVGVDPALRLHRLALARSRQAGIDVRLVGLSAEKLPVDDGSFESVGARFCSTAVFGSSGGVFDFGGQSACGADLCRKDHFDHGDADGRFTGL